MIYVAHTCNRFYMFTKVFNFIVMLSRASNIIVNNYVMVNLVRSIGNISTCTFEIEIVK